MGCADGELETSSGRACTSTRTIRGMLALMNPYFHSVTIQMPDFRLQSGRLAQEITDFNGATLWQRRCLLIPVPPPMTLPSNSVGAETRIAAQR